MRTLSRTAIVLVCLSLSLLCCHEDTEGVGEIRLSGSLDDLGGTSSSLARPDSLRGILQATLDASQDDELSGVLVRIGDLDGGPARIIEVRDALRRLSATGRVVHCHLEDATNYTYWLAASGCERLSMSPGGSLFLIGFATESYYLLDLLDSLGVEGDFLRTGAYKGAAEFLTLDDMSPETRETLDDMLDDLTEDLVRGISEGRELDPATVRDLIDRGPFDAETAREVGLVDAVEYRDEALEALQETIPGDAPLLERYRDRSDSSESPGALELVLQSSRRPASGPRVAVMYLSGPIAGGLLGGGLFGDQISLSQVHRAAEAIRRDPDIKAVVVRIESPGGSASVSDEIWHELMRIREERPVVASMGDVAASGGYYIATAATEIFAQPDTITGSIGVIGGKVVFGDALERIGVRPVLLSRGRNAGLMSLTRPFSPSQHLALERFMTSAYDRFIACVVQGRAMDEDAVRHLATGRVWTGRRAVELGLVDQLGGLHDAIALARELGELDEDAPVEVFPKPLSLVEQVEHALNGPNLSISERALAASPSGLDDALLSRALPLALLLDGEPVLTYWPVLFDIN